MATSATISPTHESVHPLTMRRVDQCWWSLAAGWFWMLVSPPVLSAALARIPGPPIHLAAWGLVWSLALIFASLIMMLLSASTALSGDWTGFCQVRRYGWFLSLALT